VCERERDSGSDPDTQKSMTADLMSLNGGANLEDFHDY
jgi:hypothetical protein